SRQTPAGLPRQAPGTKKSLGVKRNPTTARNASRVSRTAGQNSFIARRIVLTSSRYAPPCLTAPPRPPVTSTERRSPSPILNAVGLRVLYVGGTSHHRTTTRQVELRDRQFMQPASCCVNTTAYLSPIGR